MNQLSVISYQLSVLKAYGVVLQLPPIGVVFHQGFNCLLFTVH
ncbi:MULTISPECIES: hypothetical protein [unclassified Nostoc]|nr:MULTISPECIES: hypothetical protein [unclassified Nostoc]